MTFEEWWKSLPKDWNWWQQFENLNGLMEDKFAEFVWNSALKSFKEKKDDF